MGLEWGFLKLSRLKGEHILWKLVQTLKNFTVTQLKELFESVQWESAAYPHRLKRGMKHSSYVLSAWDDEKLIVLVRCLDDGTSAAFIHYLLVRPDYQKYHVGSTLMEKMMKHYQDYLYVKVMPSGDHLVPFYQKFGFEQDGIYCAMEVKRIGTLKDI